MVEINVFDWELNRIALLSDYMSLVERRSYSGVSTIAIRIAYSPEVLSVLKHQHVLSLSTDVTFGYLIQRVDYADEKGERLEVTAYSLNCIFWFRCIDEVTSYTGTPDQIIAHFVDRHLINPSNERRKLDRIVMGAHRGAPFSEPSESTKTGGSLFDHLFSICTAHEFCVDVHIDLVAKRFVVQTWKGFDRSTEQALLPHIIFSKDFDNLIRQNYTHDESRYLNCAVVAGEGEGVHRTKLVVGDELSGLERRELYVDARDLQSEKEGGAIIPPLEYAGMLSARGVEKISATQKVITFSSQIDTAGQFGYGSDFSLGDVVTVRSAPLQIIQHARIASVETGVMGGFTTMSISFGSERQTFIEQIRKELELHGS